MSAFKSATYFATSAGSDLTNLLKLSSTYSHRILFSLKFELSLIFFILFLFFDFRDLKTYDFAIDLGWTYHTLHWRIIVSEGYF